MSHTISVSFADKRSYNIHLGCVWRRELAAFKNTSLLVGICDSVFHSSKHFDSSFVDHMLWVPGGEQSKTREAKSNLEDQLLALGVDKNTILVAIGGGSIGDLVGFVAATLFRGIKYIQVPTTLLAMVDAGVGGKTAVNHCLGKNLIGAFHQPLAVLIDLRFLESLTDRDIANGLAEIAKAAIAGDCSLWTDLVAIQSITAFRVNPLPVISKAVQYKARIVMGDERDEGIRNELNFGHTVGHAVETLSPNLLHGECVSVGMILELLCLRAVNHLADPGLVQAASNMLTKFGLPVTMPSVDIDKFTKLLKNDKKSSLTNLSVPIVAVHRLGVTLGPTRTLGVPLKTVLRIVAPAVEVVPAESAGLSRVTLPGSKSVANRVLLLAAWQSESKLYNVPPSVDVGLMIEAIQALGLSEFTHNEAGVITVSRPANYVPVNPIIVHVGNSGTTARFLLPVAALLVATKKLESVQFVCDARMKERPVQPLIDALKTGFNNVVVRPDSGWLCVERVGEFVPVSEISVDPSLSSQFVSALLMIAPQYPVPLRIRLSGPAVSEPFIRMTEQLVALWQNKIRSYIVPGDAAAASYPLAIAALTGRSVRVNIEPNGLQSDYAFVSFLKKLDCVVEHDEGGTIVTGPKNGLFTKEEHVWDMNDCSDTFLTAAVLLARLGCKARITNIANQRVKECDRIAAMVENLTKCGYSVEGTRDGISFAVSTEAPREADVRTWNDHRVAMAMATLGSVHGGIRIENPRCVEKTFPNFWDMMEHDLNLPIIPAAAIASKRIICLVGMRGIGKSTLGRRLATALNRPFIDLDEYLVQSTAKSIAALIAQHGWQQFRVLERSALQSVLHTSEAIVSTGGGTVEGAADLLRQCETVWIRSDDATTVAAANFSASQSEHSVVYPEPVEAVYERRKSLYRGCSRWDVFVEHGKGERGISDSLGLLLQMVPRFTNPLASPGSTFVCLTAPSYVNWTLADFTKAIGPNDAVEFRIDFLEKISEFLTHVGAIRRKVDKPIILTYRTNREGGCGTEDDYSSVLQDLIRAMPDWVDVQVNSAIGGVIEEYKESPVRFISSLHLPTVCIPKEKNLRSSFSPVLAPNWSSIGKLIFGKSDSPMDCARLAVTANSFDKPCIAFCMQSPVSRALNAVFTPVCVSDKSVCMAAPGQMDYFELMKLRSGIAKSEFHLFGSPVDQSPSPFLHNLMFALQKASAQYTAFPAGELNESLVSEIRDNPSFRGASVTIPLKESMYRFCESAGNFLSPQARLAGSVNTLVAKSSGMQGHNTDIIALQHVLNAARLVTPAVNIAVVGTGGAARGALVAAKTVSNSIRVIGRDLDKCKLLETEFSTCPGSDSFDVVIACVPASAQLDLLVQCPRLIGANTLVVEMAYIPRETPFVLRGQECGAQIVFGSEILILQAIEQHKLWMAAFAEDGLALGCKTVDPEWLTNQLRDMNAT